MSAPTIASLRAKVLRSMWRGPARPDIGVMSHADRNAYLFAASGTEAGTGETEGLAPKDDGPVGEAETPKETA